MLTSTVTVEHWAIHRMYVLILIMQIKGFHVQWHYKQATILFYSMLSLRETHHFLHVGSNGSHITPCLVV